MEGKRKILVSAYACEPNMGTEIGVGWHWTLEMSRYFELWVLTRKSNRNSIELWFQKSSAHFNIHFVYFDLPKALRFWKKGLRGVRLYYILWQLLTNRIVKKTMLENDIRIYHLLTYGNALWPANSYGMKQFFIWGPTGGVDSIPFEYSKYYPLKARWVEWLRRTVVKSLSYNIGFQRRCKNADLVFCKSNSIYFSIPEKYRSRAMLFTDVAVEPRNLTSATRSSQSSNVNYLAVGRLDPWRGFDILIEAFAIASKSNRFIHLKIVGDGIDKKRLQQLIKEKDLEHMIDLPGKIPIEEYYTEMQGCDVVVNPCLKEGAVTVSFDALAFGKPLIGIETGGYTRYFKPEYSQIILRGERDETVANLNAAILKLTDREIRERMSDNALKAGRKFTWETKGKEIAYEIERAYSRSGEKTL